MPAVANVFPAGSWIGKVTSNSVFSCSMNGRLVFLAVSSSLSHFSPISRASVAAMVWHPLGVELDGVPLENRFYRSWHRFFSSFGIPYQLILLRPGPLVGRRLPTYHYQLNSIKDSACKGSENRKPTSPLVEIPIQEGEPSNCN